MIFWHRGKQDHGVFVSRGSAAQPSPTLNGSCGKLANTNPEASERPDTQAACTGLRGDARVSSPHAPGKPGCFQAPTPTPSFMGGGEASVASHTNML